MLPHLLKALLLAGLITGCWGTPASLPVDGNRQPLLGVATRENSSRQATEKDEGSNEFPGGFSLIGSAARPGSPPARVILSPDGKWLAYINFSPEALETAARNREPLTGGFLTLLNVRTGEVEQLETISVATRGGLAWHPNSTELYFIEAGPAGALARYDLKSGRVDPLSVPSRQWELYTGTLRWLPTGQLLYTRLTFTREKWRHGHIEIWSLDPATNQQQQVLAFLEDASPRYLGGPYPEQLVLPLAVSPVAQQVAFLVGNRIDPNRSLATLQGLYRLDLASRTAERLEALQGGSNLTWSPDGRWIAASSSQPDAADLHLFDTDTGEVWRLSQTYPQLLSSLAKVHLDTRASYAIRSVEWAGDHSLHLSVSARGAGRHTQHFGLALDTRSKRINLLD